MRGLGLVTRGPDPHDARRAACCSPHRAGVAARVSGCGNAGRSEFRAEVGNDVATVVAIGLEAYGGGD